MIDPAEKYCDELGETIHEMHYTGEEIENPELFKLLCEELDRVLR